MNEVLIHRARRFSIAGLISYMALHCGPTQRPFEPQGVTVDIPKASKAAHTAAQIRAEFKRANRRERNLLNYVGLRA